MKIAVGIARVLVGVLFIISGFIKLNDPLGFSYKLQEYFSQQVLDLEFLIPFSLVLAIILVVFELVLGIMLLIGYLPRFTLWSLLVMIVFFTFLTFYSAYYEKVKDCGCFGDALPLTPWQSFYKDIVLLALVLLLFFNRKYITPILAPASHRWIIFLAFMLCFTFAYYVLMHLPVIDFRAYKVGNNIPELMRLPEGAKKPEYEYSWKFKQNGEEVVVKNNGVYPDVEGEFIGVETRLKSKGQEPKIPDFQIQKQGEDFAEELFNEENLLMIVAYNLRNTETEGFAAIKSLSEEARSKGYRVVGLTSSGEEAQQKLKDSFNLEFEFYQSDETLLKTIVRANPGILTLSNGTITQKVHWFDADKIKL